MADAKPSSNDRQRIKRLWRDYLRPQGKRLVVAFIFMALLAVATAAYTSVVAFIIDRAEGLDTEADALSNAGKYALVVLPVLLGITLVSGVSNYIQRIYCNAIALNAVADMQKQMFASSHAADYASFTREPIGNLISKFINDVTVISNALIRALSNLIKDFLTIVFTLGFMLYHNWQLTLVVGLLYPIAAWPIIKITQRLRGNAQDVQAHVGIITSDLKESFGGSRLIRTYALEERERSRLGRVFDERIRLFLKLVTEQARVDPILEVLGGLAIAGVVIFGVWQVSAGTASAGSIAAVLTGLLVLSPRIRALGTLNNVVQEGLSALSRIFSVIDEAPTIVDKDGAIELRDAQGAVSFENVSFAYPDGTSALSDISFDVDAGETVALVGASGGGKSTIINLVPRLYDVSAGTISIDGHDIRSLTQKSLRSNLALVSQDVTLFNDRVAANIAMGDLEASRDEIKAAARAADAHDFILKLNEGYDTIIGEDGDTLSGGQKQRLSIARALLRDAPILLLDEATSALDTQSEAKVQAGLDRLSNGRTTIIVAHRLSTIRNADHIYVLENGRIVESGDYASLSRKKGGVFAKLRSLQDV